MNKIKSKDIYPYVNDKPQVFIREILKVRNITYKQLSKMCLERFIEINGGLMYLTKSCGDRNYLMRLIRGAERLIYKPFIFIICEILGESIPVDNDLLKELNQHGNMKDITGKRFHKWLVIRDVSSNKNGHRWLCRCDCGTEKEVNGGSLLSGKTKSCGCTIAEVLIIRNTTHGKSGTPEHQTWKHIIQRCTNPNRKDYHNYGGRGITVCDRWRSSFENFYEDMGDRPENMSLDRIENNGNYEPGNCRWATKEEQCNNQRKTLRFKDGTPVSVWARANSVSRKVATRIYNLSRTNSN